MYNVKIVSDGRLGHHPGRDHSSRREQLYSCTHLQKTFHPTEHKVVVELMPSGTTIVLPDDGDVIYIMDSGGKTVDSVRYDEALFQPPPISPDDQDLTELNFDRASPNTNPNPDPIPISKPRKEFRA